MYKTMTLILAGLGLTLAACGDGGPSLEKVEDAAWASCFVFGESNPVMEDTWQDWQDGTITAGKALGLRCGMAITREDSGWSVLLVGSDYKSGGFGAALATFGEETGCLSDLDLDKVSHTRALDGRVESGDGHASWTYHPDDGLSLICEA